MKNITLIILSLTALVASYANAKNKKNYLIDDISSSLYGEIEYNLSADSSGVIQIYRRENDKPLIQVNAKSIALNFDIDSSQKSSTPKNIPYTKQSLIIYDDFNFDQVKDFAIFDGRNSCYGGPSFQIYLAKGEAFQLSPTFTQLAQDYCGMFSYFANKKQLKTSSKSGCCWLTHSTFVVENNQPKVIEIVEDHYTGIYVESEISRWNGSSMSKSKQKRIYDEGDGSIQDVFVFSLTKNNKKQVKLFIATDDNTLHYAFINDGQIEFNYPKAAGEQRSFVYSQSEDQKTLVFYNGKTKYNLYQRNGEQGVSQVGILVTTNGKDYNLVGDLSTLNGGLDKVSKGITNVSGDGLPLQH